MPRCATRRSHHALLTHGAAVLCAYACAGLHIDVPNGPFVQRRCDAEVECVGFAFSLSALKACWPKRALVGCDPNVHVDMYRKLAPTTPGSVHFCRWVPGETLCTEHTYTYHAVRLPNRK